MLPRMAETVTIVLGADGKLPVVCHAGEPVSAVRGVGKMEGSEVPGVRCRIAHETIDMVNDPMSIGMFCCLRDGTHDGKAGFRRCPLWDYEQRNLEAGRRSMGDEAVKNQEDEAVLREDLTGSRHGDVSWLDELGESARRAMVDMQQSRDGFVGAEAGRSVREERW